MRKPIVAGNWKMHKTAAEAVDLAQAIAPLVAPSLTNCDVVLCPTYIRVSVPCMELLETAE